MTNEDTQLELNRGANGLIRPQPRTPINIRAAAPGSGDFEFIDSLQKQHSKALGFMHRQALENYIESGDVLIAEERDEETERRRDEVEEGASVTLSPPHPLIPSATASAAIGISSVKM